MADIIYASFLCAVSELFFMNLSYSYCLILMDNTNGIKYTVTMKAFQKTGMIYAKDRLVRWRTDAQNDQQADG